MAIYNFGTTEAQWFQGNINTKFKHTRHISSIFDCTLSSDLAVLKRTCCCWLSLSRSCPCCRLGAIGDQVFLKNLGDSTFGNFWSVAVRFLIVVRSFVQVVVVETPSSGLLPLSFLLWFNSGVESLPLVGALSCGFFKLRETQYSLRRLWIVCLKVVVWGSSSVKSFSSSVTSVLFYKFVRQASVLTYFVSYGYTNLQ